MVFFQKTCNFAIRKGKTDMNKIMMKWALFQATEIARKLRNKKLVNLLAEF